MKNFASKLLLGLIKPILITVNFINSISAAIELMLDVIITGFRHGYDYITSTAWWKTADSFCIELSELYTEIWDLVERTGLININDTVKVMLIKIVWAIIHTINIIIALAMVALVFLACCEPC